MNKSRLYFLGMMGGLGVASNDIYISCLSDIGELHCLNAQTMNTTLIIYFIATAFTSLLSPYFLRILSLRKLYISAAVVFILACLIISISHTLVCIVMGRIMQGMAFGVIQPILIAKIKESFRNKTSNALASFSLSAELLSIISPIMGGICFTYISWNSPFLLLGEVDPRIQTMS